MSRAQEDMVKYANRHRQAVSFEVDDLVWLNGTNLRSNRPSKKLDDKIYGPFKVIDKHGPSCVLQLPPGFRVYNTFHVKLLLKDPNNPLPGQSNPEPAPVDIDGKKEWEVDYIIALRLYHQALEYRAQWTDVENDPAWYPADFFRNAPRKIREFHNANPDMPRPRRLPRTSAEPRPPAQNQTAQDNVLPAQNQAVQIRIPCRTAHEAPA